MPQHHHDKPEQAAFDEIPCAVIVGGSLSHTKDSQLVRNAVPMGDALKRLTHSLGKAG